MNKLFNIFIEAVYWFLIFLSPFLIFSIVATIIYVNNSSNLWLPIGLIIIGIVLGIILAERIRRKYGTSQFMSRITGGD